ncbi:MAG: hypothetical protein A2283_16580 [Lentisphaerae bacterium RIFOXYA12_FULL_48_11]|nr:MAG: hypothetical protein A2283_16580 [Lentisphaerae bacterium RIFOXYA12_FULL_48_11]
MLKRLILNVGLAFALNVAGQAALLAAPDDLAARFLNPPDSTKPRCYWYWIDGHVSREGITHDLEAMKRVGIGEGYIGIIGGGEIKALTEDWWQLIEHAVREGGRIGVDVGLFNCPGWSQSGGPWIKPEQSMRYVALQEMRVTGPKRFEGKLPKPEGDFQDLAVLAFPVPANDVDDAVARGAKVTRKPESILFEMREPFTARSLVVHPVNKVRVKADLQVSDDGQQYRTLRKFDIDRHNLNVNVGPVPLSPIAISFPAVTAKYFRLSFSGPCELGDVRVSPAARLESYPEKQLAKVFQDPLPPYDFYTWPQQAEPELESLVIKRDEVIDISRKMDKDGILTWDPPSPGSSGVASWIVLRAVLMPTGTKNSPAPPEATGLEVDKMNREALKSHFDAYVGKLLARIPEKERRAFKHVVADSYEMGPQNWTDGMAADFKKCYGYDPIPFLPVMTGRVVDSADQSDRFLWDLRRMIADRVSRDYVGGLRDLCNKHGLKMWLENYGHWGFPGEFLQYGGNCDEISGEFWANGNLGSIELRDASSAAHIYGKPIVWAEAFTGGPAFQSTPASLKARGDWSYCEGINQFVLHVYIHQPWDDKLPGVNAWFGTEFNRNNTWYDYSRPWIDYQRRCSVMLQAGKHVADVAYFIGEDAPKMAGLCKPKLPAGYNFDYINAEVLENNTSVKDGRLVLKSGMSYRLLVLPDQATMRPALLNKIRDLVKRGGVVLGQPPLRSPSMEDYPSCDAKVKKLADELWGNGLVMTDRDLPSAFNKLKIPPDVICPAGILWTHRRDGDLEIYFLSNQRPSSRTETIAFRANGLAPEFWWPETGRIEKPAVYDVDQDSVKVPVHFGPNTSVFVVFREKARNNRVVEVTCNGRQLFDMTPSASSEVEESANTFTMAMWAKPSADTVLPSETNSGVRGLHDKRNDVFQAAHGDSFAPGGTHAGSGVSIGRNGIAVFEHGAGYFVPILVHSVQVTGWTHVAVVYRDGEPSLYLNGKFVRKGLKSSKTVHSSVTSAGADAKFSGKVSRVESLPRALDETDLAKLMGSAPGEGAGFSGLPIELTFNADNKLEVAARASGSYTWKTAEGAVQKLEVASVQQPVEVKGSWEVSFYARTAVESHKTVFDKLISWTDRPEEEIKYYSGVAVYSKIFEMPNSEKSAFENRHSKIYLDLGEVRDIARVRVNGHDAGTVWKQPYRLDVTKLVKQGENQLEVEVVNTWLNRLIGDEQPDAKKSTFAITKSWKADTMLLPAGLLGPVIVVQE